jgi:hypothetical protein
VNGTVIPDVLEDHWAFILEVILEELDCEDEGNITVQNITNYSPSDIMSHPKNT